jgi:hypothetical protein
VVFFPPSLLVLARAVSVPATWVDNKRMDEQSKSLFFFVYWARGLESLGYVWIHSHMLSQTHSTLPAHRPHNIKAKLTEYQKTMP